MNTDETVQHQWGSPILIGDLDIAPLVNSDAVSAVPASGQAQEVADATALLADPDGLAAEFLASFTALAATEQREPPSGVDVTVQVWRGGYDLPSAGFESDYVAWCFLNDGTGRSHDESGAVSVADPRSGSAMTAMPGLPFGRQVIIRHRQGAHIAVPGWLTCSVVPVEAGQRAVVAFATSRR